MRKPIIAGNWKMYKTMTETDTFVKAIDDLFLGNIEVVLCVPYTDLVVLRNWLGENVRIGSQNIHWESEGAFTGEISPLMLKELNVKYAIVGHSERREFFGETDLMVNMRVNSAIKHNITPIICVGEKLEDREAEKTEAVVGNQVKKALSGLSLEQVSNLVIAYEPIWAIGTGKSSSPEDANEVIGFIRKIVVDLYNQNTANQVRIQYGGSVNSENIETYMNQPEIDGALVGGASLEPENFKVLINKVNKEYK